MLPLPPLPPKQSSVALLLLCLWSFSDPVRSFKSSNNPAARCHCHHRVSPTSLHASAAKKKKKGKRANAKGAVGGGFGAAPASRKPKREDGLAYPDLEPQVRQTLVPSSDVVGSGPLPEEMYDRLEDIYGLERFNFGGEGAIYMTQGTEDGGGVASGPQEDEDNASLFEDILSGGTTGGKPSSSDSVLDDLFSASSASEVTAVSDDSPLGVGGTTSSHDSSVDLNELPPFKQFRVLHVDPMVIAVDDFFTSEECDKYVQMSIDAENNQDQEADALQPLLLGQSQTVGKDSRSKAQRTSTTWFHHYAGVPELMARAARLLGLPGISRFEEPQTVRYRRSEKFTWHLVGSDIFYAFTYLSLTLLGVTLILHRMHFHLMSRMTVAARDNVCLRYWCT